MASAPLFAEAEAKEVRRLEAAAEVIQDMVDTPEGIPRDLLNKAYCIAIIPSPAAAKPPLRISRRVFCIVMFAPSCRIWSARRL